MSLRKWIMQSHNHCHFIIATQLETHNKIQNTHNNKESPTYRNKTKYKRNTNNTSPNPKVWIGQCVNVDGDEIVVTPFKEVDSSLYICHCGEGKKRIPIKDTVSPIDFVHCRLTTHTLYAPRKLKCTCSYH